MPSFAKPAKGTRLLERRARRVERDQALADAYADVDARDAGICWASGAYTQHGAPMAEQRREHHHLRGRRVMPEWRHDPHHIITVSKLAHDLITGGFLVVEGDDARKPIRFHWQMPKGTKPPFHLRSKRWSQNDAD